MSPATTGLVRVLAVHEGIGFGKEDRVYVDLHHFSLKIFPVNFAMGIVSRPIMAHHFGTSQSHVLAFVGSIACPLLAHEVLTAVFP